MKVNAVSGKRTVIIHGSQLTPKRDSRPLAVEHFWLSDDEKHVLIFTNSAKVWRQNTRGDFWVLDVVSGQLCSLAKVRRNPR